MALPYTSRKLQDSGLAANVAMPIAANTTSTNGIDLTSASPYPVTEKIVCRIETTASAGTANSKNVNIRLMDSADNGNWANMAIFANPLLMVTDNSGTTPASSIEVTLPPNTRRYIKAAAVGEANGGNAADATMTLKLLF
jgi:hypothetical protein